MDHSAGILFYTQKDNITKVLLVHPSGKQNTNSSWGIPKGLIDKNESEIETAIREVSEEIGIEVLKKDITFLADVIYSNRKKIVYCFFGKVPEGQIPKINSWEIDKVEWFTLEEAEKIMHKDQVKFISDLRFYLTYD